MDRKWHDPSALRARACPSSAGAVGCLPLVWQGCRAFLPSLIIRTCNLEVQRYGQHYCCQLRPSAKRPVTRTRPVPNSVGLAGSAYHSGRCHTWNPATPHTAYLDVKLQTRYTTVCRSAASLRPRTWQTHKSRMVSGLELSTKGPRLAKK